MRSLDREQGDGVFRKPSLIAGATRKMALTYVGGAVCASLVTIIDSLIAGVSIGPEALAAIAAAAPLLSIGQILHCMLGFGLDKLMIQAIGEGKRKEANRIFGGILFAVLVVYLLVYVLLLCVERPLLLLLMDDVGLVDLMVSYTQPLFMASPVFEVLLCCERAFRIDGRAKLFSMRSIIMNIANIVFDFLLVSDLGLGIAGLAWASVISTIMGHSVTLIHFASKKRTISPDFSVLFSIKELLGYVKRDICMGSSATLDEVMSSVALSVQTVAIGVVGGSGGLAIWAVYKSLRGVILSAGNGISASVSIHAGLQYGEGDYDGSRYSVKEGMKLAQSISVLGALVVLIFAWPICVAYGVESELLTTGAWCLRCGCLSFPSVAFFAVLTAYLPAVNRVKLTNRFVLIQYVLLIISAAMGYLLDLQGFFVCYLISSLVVTLILCVFLARDRFWFIPRDNPLRIASYSIELVPNQISSMSEDANKRMRERVHLESLRFASNPMTNKVASFCSSIALVVEDSMNYILQNNPDSQVTADIEIKQHENAVMVVIIDDGSPYNPLAYSAEAEWSDPGTLEAAIVLGLAAETHYDRVLDLNQLRMLVRPQVRPSEDG